jgi:hypothetical protein
MTTLLPDTVSTSPVPTDWTEGLVHELPHAAVEALAAGKLTIPTPAAASAMTVAKTLKSFLTLVP